MGSRREQLQEKLEKLTGYPVYFRPPTGFRIPTYPCVIYDIDSSYVRSADNIPYLPTIKYKITLLTRDPDDPVFNEIFLLGAARCISTRQTAGINEFVYTVYF